MQRDNKKERQKNPPSLIWYNYMMKIIKKDRLIPIDSVSQNRVFDRIKLLVQSWET